MKKIIIMFVLSGIMLLSSCVSTITSGEMNLNVNEDNIKSHIETCDLININARELKEMYIKLYKEDKLATKDNSLYEKYSSLGYTFINENNIRKIGILGTLQVCYYPIEIKNHLVYINSMGKLCIDKHDGQTVLNAHIPENITEKYDVICTSPKETIILKKDVIQTYSFGEVIRSWNIPEEWQNQFTYCGYSYFSGFIFRNTNNVYAIDLFNNDSDFHIIASGVKMVIDADYEYSSDATCAPLFLMEDGSVKVYMEWDDKLYPLYYEGEWNDVHSPHIPYEYAN